MQVLDASAVIYGWDNYPIKQFKPVWNWLSTEIQKGIVTIPIVALEEVADNSPECAAWLKDQGIMTLAVTNSVLAIAIAIKAELGIANDQYHAKGVGENDIFIVSVAKDCGGLLISNEAMQVNPPDVAAKMKIPRVCLLATVTVQCINFLDFLKASKQAFY